MVDNDLFVDDDHDNHLDFLRKNRGQRPNQPSYQRNKIEQDIRVVNEDEDFNYGSNQRKPHHDEEEEQPQRLFDIIKDNNADEAPNDYYKNSQANRSKIGTRQSYGQSYSRGASTTNYAQNVDDLLYQNEDVGRSQQKSNYYGESTNNDDPQGYSYNNSRPTTSSNRPGTSTSILRTARAKLAEQQRARLAQAKNSTNTEGTLVTNQMLRTSSKPGDYFQANQKYEYRNQGSDFFYDPTFKQMDKSGLPELSKTNVFIKYQAEEVDPSSYARESHYHNHQEPPQKQETYQQHDYKVEHDDSPQDQYPVPPKELSTRNSELRSSVVNEEEKSMTPSEIQQEKDSSDEEPTTKEELKALEKQRKELNKQQDAEIGIAHPGEAQQASEAVSKILNLDLRDIPDMKTFLMSPCPKGYRIECTIKRDRSGFSRFYPKYHCYLSNGPQYLMSGKKRAHNKTSNYMVSYNKNEIKKNSPYCLGKLRSNFMGTEFNIYDDGLNPNKSRDIERLRANIGVVLYESNLLSAKGPRKMKVYLPEVSENTAETFQFKPLSEKDGIMSNWKSGKRTGIKEYVNKNPKWNEQLQAFVLNFNGRVEKPSVKNFQLIDERNDERIFLQFGRVTNDTFNMDFEWPLSPFQAFSICLSSFDYKIACE